MFLETIHSHLTGLIDREQILGCEEDSFIAASRRFTTNATAVHYFALKTNYAFYTKPNSRFSVTSDADQNSDNSSLNAVLKFETTTLDAVSKFK